MSHFETALELEPDNEKMLKLLSRSTAMMNMKIWNDEYDSEEDDFVDLFFWKDDEFTDDEFNDDGESPHAQSSQDSDFDREDLSSVADPTTMMNLILMTKQKVHSYATRMQIVTHRRTWRSEKEIGGCQFKE